MNRDCYQRQASGLWLPGGALKSIGGISPRFFPGYPSCCGKIPCGFCTHATGPEEWSVTIAGLGDGCCTCSTFNDTFILSPHLVACYWFIETWEGGGGPCDQVSGVGLHVAANTITVSLVRVVGPPNAVVWEETYDGDPDCLSFSGENIPYSSHVAADCCGVPSGACCDDAATSTCEITAL